MKILNNAELKEETYDWIQLDEEEIIEKIIELRKAGVPPSQIGMRLRDKWGIPSTRDVLDKKITEILRQNDLEPEIPEDLRSLLDKGRKVRRHLWDHPSDKQNRRNFQLLQSKIKRLVKYYKDSGKLEEDWDYRKYVYG